MRQIALLRGINLGPRNRVAMPALRELLSAAGFEDVRTHLQSGNVILSSDEAPAAVAERCERAIARELGFAIDVVARSRDELAEVVARNPLAEVATEPKRYQVSFLERELDRAAVAELERAVEGDERLVAIGRELYAWHPHGVARSKLSAALASRSLGVKATARNWTTVTSLLELADDAKGSGR